MKKCVVLLLLGLGLAGCGETKIVYRDAPKTVTATATPTATPGLSDMDLMNRILKNSDKVQNLLRAVDTATDNEDGPTLCAAIDELHRVQTKIDDDLDELESRPDAPDVSSARIPFEKAKDAISSMTVASKNICS